MTRLSAWGTRLSARGAPAWARLRRMRPIARQALLVFAVTAGVGFGVVMALATLAGFEEAPSERVNLASDEPEDRSIAAAETTATPPAMEAEVSTDILPEAVALVAARPEAAAQPEPAVAAAPVTKAVPKAVGPAKDATPVAAAELPRSADGDTLPQPLVVARSPGQPEAPPTPPDLSHVKFDPTEPGAPSRVPPSLPGSDIRGIVAADMAFLGGLDQGPRFFMHVPTGVSQAKLQSVVSQLEQSGVKVAEIGREGFRVSATHLRYYSPETAERARQVAASLGVEARDFSQTFRDEERVEVWVAGGPGAPTSGGGSTQKRFESSSSRYGESVANR